jgi:hypothetical protein
MTLYPTLVLYFVVGVGIAVAVYVRSSEPSAAQRGLSVLLAVPFWPLYVPILLAQGSPVGAAAPPAAPPAPADEMAAAIAHVDAELEAALGSLDGWAEDVLAREKVRIHELRSAWTVQAERIREIDRLLALPEYALDHPEELPEPGPVSERLRNCRRARRQNLERLRDVRRRGYDDLMGTLAWVRELVSMIHLAKFTGAPAARAEELVAQIAAAVEGLSEVTWQDAATAPAGDST